MSFPPVGAIVRQVNGCQFNPPNPMLAYFILSMIGLALVMIKAKQN
jgi:hypothetical protein